MCGLCEVHSVRPSVRVRGSVDPSGLGDAASSRQSVSQSVSQSVRSTALLLSEQKRVFSSGHPSFSLSLFRLLAAAWELPRGTTGHDGRRQRRRRRCHLVLRRPQSVVRPSGCMQCKATDEKWTARPFSLSISLSLSLFSSFRFVLTHHAMSFVSQTVGSASASSHPSVRPSVRPSFVHRR